MSTLYTDFKTAVEKELDTEDEVFIQDAEFLEYTNKSRRIVEQAVLGIYEDYLLTYSYLALSLGVQTYNLPPGIYASKIRGIVYSNGQIVYEIKRNRSIKKFLERELIVTSAPTDYYRYIILNNSLNGIKIEISPASLETSTQNVKIWYLRKIAELTGDASDYVDSEIPESLNYLYALVKGYCKQKENAGVMPEDAKREIDEQKMLMVETLTNMVPDDDNEVLRDTSHYDESS